MKTLIEKGGPIDMEAEISLRPEVARFAALMELELQERRYKDGRYHNHKAPLIKKLLNEVGDLIVALDCNFSAEYILTEAADVANVAMWIAKTQTNYSEWSMDELIDNMRS